MENIKATYDLSKKVSWQGDPCAPHSYRWEGLNCSYPNSDPPRIISLYVLFLDLMAFQIQGFTNANSFGYFIV